MCKTCVFNPNSPLYHLREKWIKHLEEDPDECGKIHGCHMSENESNPTEDEICIGHKDWLKGIKHECHN